MSDNFKSRDASASKKRGLPMTEEPADQPELPTGWPSSRRRATDPVIVDRHHNWYVRADQ